MNGREIPPLGPDDDSEESVVDRLVIDDMRQSTDYIDNLSLSLANVFVPLTQEEQVEGHPAGEILGVLLESVQAHMAYFQVADADRITVDDIQRLDPSVYVNPLDLEDLVLIVKDELTESDKDKPVPTILTFGHIIEASNRVDIKTKLNEETKKAIAMLALGLFGQDQEANLFLKAIESPILALKIRRFAWILNQPFMEDFRDTVNRELAVRKYDQRIKGNSLPVSMSFPEVLDLANRSLRGKRVETDKALLGISPTDHTRIIMNRMLSVDIKRAIAVSETVAKSDV